ncbi:MAG: hypothetical protein U0869_07295 [Chloroflexota bacterium]
MTSAMLLVGERPSPAQLAGVGLVLAGVTLGTLPLGRVTGRMRRSGRERATAD